VKVHERPLAPGGCTLTANWQGLEQSCGRFQKLQNVSRRSGRASLFFDSQRAAQATLGAARGSALRCEFSNTRTVTPFLLSLVFLVGIDQNDYTPQTRESLPDDLELAFQACEKRHWVSNAVILRSPGG